jgi:AcrR family transcriptional regulator
MPPALSLDAETDAWRCIRAALAGEPVPVIGGDVQAVIAALAACAADGITVLLEAIGTPAEEARPWAAGFAEYQLSRLVLGEAPGHPAAAGEPA